MTTCNFFSQNCLFVTIFGLRDERDKILREHGHTMLNFFATSEKHKQPEIGYIALNLLHPPRKSLRKNRFTAAERRIFSPVLKEMQSLSSIFFSISQFADCLSSHKLQIDIEQIDTRISCSCCNNFLSVVLTL